MALLVVVTHKRKCVEILLLLFLEFSISLFLIYSHPKARFKDIFYSSLEFEEEEKNSNVIQLFCEYIYLDNNMNMYEHKL